MTKITLIEGIGEDFAQRLQRVGITTTEALLQRGATPEDAKLIADQAGISEMLVLQWVDQADLFRIKGIGGQYAQLLESAGVDSVAELAQINTGNLLHKVVELNESKKLVRRLPARSQVEDWIEQARGLPRVGEGWEGQAAEFDEAEFGEIPSPPEAMPGESAMGSLPGDGGTDNIP
jgi:predicted flap endonuclease-1-like 5' DNA nuclease